MNSKKVFAAALAAALAAGSVSVCAVAAPATAPTSKGFKVTKASALGGAGTYINANESGSVDPGATDGDVAGGSIKINGSTVEVTPSYSCYGAEKDGKANSTLTVVTDINYADGFTTTYDSGLKGVEFSNNDGKLEITVTIDMAAYGSTNVLKFQDDKNFYELNVKNNGYVGTPELSVNVSGMDNVETSTSGTNVTIVFTEKATAVEMQHAKFSVTAKVKLGDKEFTATGYEHFVLNYASTDGVEQDIYGFSTAASDSLAVGGSTAPVYAPNYKVTAKSFLSNNSNDDLPEPPPEDETSKPADSTDDSSKPVDEKPVVSDITLTGIDETGLEGDKLNAALFGDSGKNWNDVEKIEFSSDDLFSVQFSTVEDKAGTKWFEMGTNAVPAARADDDAKWATSWTIGEDELALFDTDKNDGGYAKVVAKEGTIDVAVKITYKAAANGDTNKPENSVPNNANNGTSGADNHGTGIALAISPVVLAAGAVVAVTAAKKRK